MFLHILSIICLILNVYDLVRLLRSGNAGGLSAVISRPLGGAVTTRMFWGLVIWIAELYAGCLSAVHIFHWIF